MLNATIGLNHGNLRFLLLYDKQGRSSSIGANILSFLLRQLTDDFKEEKKT